MPPPSFSFALPALFLLFVFPFSYAHSLSFHDDAQSLLSFKKLITSDPNNSLADWSPTVPLCNWTAVTCGSRHPDRVVAINLTAMDLRGTISPSLGNLSFIRSLDLSGNRLHGHIPPQLGRLFRLRSLWLHQNQLEGNIPHQLSSCRNLLSLVLNHNNLSGNIPAELGSLSHLQQLYLEANSLSEYGLGERVSTKGDVYSYGILLLEMLTRKRPTNNMFIRDLNLHKWVSLAFPDKVKEVIDNNMFSVQDGGDFEENNIHNCILSLLRVGLLCSKYSPEERPSMRDVVIVLENIKEDLVAKTIASRRSISSLLGHTNAPNITSITSNDQSSSTF